ncbi:MAG: fused MFS/spermidine synthase [Planctomycetes bacterium]|nr:fused MFS/spermidine synthase [Planctomycetota bacterium]
MSEKNVRRILLALFFLSGASALIYQLVWVRMFSLVFGVTVFAVSTVLSAFMAGLALGSLYFGRLVDRRGNPVRLFGFLQLGIGLFGLSFPYLLEGVNHLHVQIQQHAAMGFYGANLLRFALSFLLLLIPTTLMGGTLPVLSKFFVSRLKRLGWDIGHLYSVNNLGAVIGVFLAAFFLLRAIGITATINLAAAINLAVGCVALLTSGALPGSKATAVQRDDPIQAGAVQIAPEDGAPRYPRAVLYLVLWAFAIEGFAALSYEVIWSRILLVASAYKTVYCFAVIVITFIFGLSLGSFIVANFIDRKKDLLAILGFVEIAIGLFGILALRAFAIVPVAQEELYRLRVTSWRSSIFGESFIFFLVMLIPTTLMGMTFPIVGKICATNLRKLGRRIGQIGFLDTVGSIFGAFVAGFILIPFIGVLHAAIATAILNLALGAALVFFHPFMARKAKLETALLLACIGVGACLAVPASDDLRHWQSRRSDDRLLYYKQGATATVAVAQRRNGMKCLAINGGVTAFTDFADLRVHKMLAYLPLLLHRNPHNSLVIGLGMGVTAQSLIQPEIDQVECVEISPEVVEACGKCFSDVNKNVLMEPKLRVLVEDGRYRLQVTDKKYDIITTNAVHARLSPNLYTEDFYELCKARLTENGVMCQWLPTNWISQDEYWMLVKAFMHSFPHTSLWLVNVYHTILIGSPKKLEIDFGDLTRRLQEQKCKSDLKEVALQDACALLGQYVGDEDALNDYVRQAPLNSDDHPYVEFSTVLGFGPNKSVIESVLKMKVSVYDVLRNTGRSSEESARVKKKLARYSTSLSSLTQAGLSACYGTTKEELQWLDHALRVNPDDQFAKYLLGKTSYTPHKPHEALK